LESTLNKEQVKSLERKRVFYLFLFFFFVIAVFWTLKPLKTSEVVKSFSLDYYPLIKQGLVLVIPLVIMGYAFLSSFLSRVKLVYFFCAVFIILDIVFFFAFQYANFAWVKIAFFYYVDAYVTIMVTMFWTFVNDINNSESAKKVYWIVGTGGLLGGILGSSIAGWASHFLGSHIMLVAAIFTLPIVFFVTFIENGLRKQFGPAIGTKPACANKKDQPGYSEFYEGVTTVFKSKYLICVLLVVGLYEIISTIIDYQFNAFASVRFETAMDFSSFQGKLFFWAQVAALVVQLLLTPFIHKNYGVLTGLMFLPLALFVGSLAFLVSPLLFIIVFIIGSEAALAYSINQASKEILYVPLDETSKYKGKAFIDMFGLRFFKTVGATILLFYTLHLQHIGFTSDFLMGTVVVLILVWFNAIFYAGHKFKVKALESPVKKKPDEVATELVAEQS